MSERYTRREVARILGVEEGQLAYWERLRLVKSRARWGERFYHFGDLVALKTIQSLTERHVPVRRLHRALRALQTRFGDLQAPLSALRLLTYGREIVVVPPGPRSVPIEPLTGQLHLPYDEAEQKIHTIAGRSAQEWFEIGLASDGHRDTLPQAVEAYRRATELQPGWVAAHINLGASLYQLSDLEAARDAFQEALARANDNPTAHFNLGCVLDDLEEVDSAIEHLQRAVDLEPFHADAHFNLALTLEKRGQYVRARDHWRAYLRLEPRGPWSDFARTKLRPRKEPGPPIPFPRKSS